MQKPTRHFAREVRRARHVSAWIVCNGRADSECQVLDISPNGAKVVVALRSQLPQRFELAFQQDDRKRRACEVMWRRGKMVGVKFVIGS
jgi:hypothetical protein